MHGVRVSNSSDSVPVHAVEGREPDEGKGGVVEEERGGFLCILSGL